MARKRKKARRTVKRAGTKRRAKGTVPLEVLENRAAHLVDLVHRRGGTPRHHKKIKHRHSR